MPGLKASSRIAAAILLMGSLAVSSALAESAIKIERLRSDTLSNHPAAGTIAPATKSAVKAAPRTVGQSDPAKYLYVADIAGNTVSIMDTGTRAVVATIPVGNSPSGIAVNADGSQAYAVNRYGNSVSVIAVAQQKVSATVKVGSKPSAVAVTPNGATLYVANEKSGTVSIIDTGTLGVKAVAIGKAPVALAVNPSGSRVYVANSRDNNVAILDTATNAVTKVPVGNNPSGIAINASGTAAYVTNQDDNTVTVLSLANNATATVSVGSSPIGVAVNPDGSRVYVANNGDNTVSVIDANTNAVLHTIAVGNSPQGIAVGSRGIDVYVTNVVDNTVSVIDTAKNAVTATVSSIGNAPISAAMASGAVTYAYVAGISSQGAPSIMVLNAATYEQTATVGLGVGGMPYAIAAAPSGKAVYVTQPGTNTVTPINTATNTAGTPIAVGHSPRGIAVAPSGKFVYAANFMDGTVSIIDLTNNNQVTPVTVGNLPDGIAIDPAGAFAYVVACDSTGRNGWLSIINLSSNAVSQPYSTGAGCLVDAKVSPDGSKLFVAQDAGSAGTNLLSFAIPVGANPAPAVLQLSPALGFSPSNLLVSPSGNRVYITITEPPGRFGSNVAVIDTSTNAVSSVLTTFWPQGAALTPAGHQLFVSATGWYYPNFPNRRTMFDFAIVDTRTLTRIKTMALGNAPLMGVAFATVYPQ